MTACYLGLPEVELNYIYQHGLISPNFCHQQGVVGGGPLMQHVMLWILFHVWQFCRLDFEKPPTSALHEQFTQFFVCLKWFQKSSTQNLGVTEGAFLY